MTECKRGSMNFGPTGGAMRLPGLPNNPKAKHHYLTDYYINHFGLRKDLAKFNNADDNAFLKFYNMEPVTYTGMIGIIVAYLLHA